MMNSPIHRRNQSDEYTNPHTLELDSLLHARQSHDIYVNELMSRYRSRQYPKRTSQSQSQHNTNMTLKGTNPRRTKTRQTSEETSDIEGSESELQMELMTTLMAGLRREVQRAEEEGWMFGEREGGVDWDDGYCISGGGDVGEVGAGVVGAGGGSGTGGGMG
jgi:hypothetical protein